MRPKHSLNHNIKSVPLVLTGNTEDDGCRDCYGRHEGMDASVLAGVGAPPVFQSSEHDLDFMALSIVNGVLGDVDFAVSF